MPERRRQRLTFLGDRAPIRRAPDPDSEQLSELIHGEEVLALARSGDWVLCEHKGIVVKGYVWRPDLEAERSRPTHVVRLPFAYLYSRPTQLACTSRRLPMNAAIRLTGGAAPLLYPGGRPGMECLRLDTGGWILSSAVAPLGEHGEEITLLARRFIDTPFVCGGRSYMGMDEGGLIQAVLMRLGNCLPHVRASQPDLLLSALRRLKQPSSSGGILACGPVLGVWTSSATVIFASAEEMCVVEVDGRELIERMRSRAAVRHFAAEHAR